MTERDVGDKFDRYGRVKDVRIVRNMGTGESKGERSLCAVAPAGTEWAGLAVRVAVGKFVHANLCRLLLCGDGERGGRGGCHPQAGRWVLPPVRASWCGLQRQLQLQLAVPAGTAVFEVKPPVPAWCGLFRFRSG